MITHYPYETLGHADHGWLKARHHFSFGMYRDPKRMHFGTLRVINDDVVQPGAGFEPHPHRDMEIITYVRSGAISHRDSVGNEGKTSAGDVQVMSAGSGIVHSEYNHEPVATNLYQIWITPNQRGVAPRWEMHRFPKQPSADGLTLLVAGDGSAPLFIHQDAYLYAGVLPKGTRLTHRLHHAQAYLLLSRGEVTIDGITLKQGDGAEVIHTENIEIVAAQECELLVIDVPA